MHDLSKYGLIYLATPYSKYPTGIEQAFIAAAKLTAKLMTAGAKVYSPIVHMHPIAIHGDIDPYSHAIWMPFDQAIMDKADACVVAMMPSWEWSKGITMEIEYFAKNKKPIIFLDPKTMETFSA